MNRVDWNIGVDMPRPEVGDTFSDDVDTFEITNFWNDGLMDRCSLHLLKGSSTVVDAPVYVMLRDYVFSKRAG